MKKLTIFIIALLYITTSSGVMINKHYCMGEILAWNFLTDNTQSCSGCGMAEADTNGCCHNEQKFLKIEKDQHLAVSELQLPWTDSTFLPTDIFILSSPSFSFLTVARKNYFEYQWEQSLPLFIINCTFRI